ncbi:MAG: dodecin domain-containing protein [Alcanivorax sp.]|jgi:flavin-binding protein dodecin|nr:dodecin domain-containing protein [Alcanivorax sp.]
MTDHVYKKLELAGSSKDSIEDAVRNAIAAASKSVNNVEWFEVQETRGHVENGQVAHFQVVVKVGFRVDT